MTILQVEKVLKRIDIMIEKKSWRVQFMAQNLTAVTFACDKVLHLTMSLHTFLKLKSRYLSANASFTWLAPKAPSALGSQQYRENSMMTTNETGSTGHTRLWLLSNDIKFGRVI